MQEAVQLGVYLLPDLSTLTTSLSQERELQTLREHSVVAFETLSDESIRIKKLVASFSNNHPSALSILTDAQAHEHTFVDAKDQPLMDNRSSSHVNAQVVHYSNKGRRALVVKCFPRIHRKVTGSNHSGLAIHEFSSGCLFEFFRVHFHCQHLCIQRSKYR